MPIDHLPHRVRPGAYRLRAWAMGDGPALLFASVLSTFLGLSYFGVFGGYDAQIHPIEHITDQKFWAGTWLAVGVCGLIAACIPCSRTRNVVFTVWSAMMLLWGTSYFLGWTFGHLDRGVALSIFYCATPFLVAWTVWRGSRSELILKGDADGLSYHSAR
ncbi:hypothetical protein CKALI_11220 [Corynebacterium kalinowskii]|uniref:Uncharacterized protein n=1 Tax=Corynebacterium kalinowskii TaxID=2675216 RepID=A0A6B8W7L7_9CORY|nr:hypothetical protein [Corynebacterium kalinowskii]QGU03088.1 hypothetical protein CKALI_11220 [Corynebacterium kalinowskii]